MFKYLKINILFFILFSLTSFELLALDKYWVATDCSVTNYFDNNANWSLTPNGEGGARRPNKNDIAYFGKIAASSDCNAEIRTRTVIQKLILANNYDGTVSVNDNLTLSLKQNFAIREGTLFLGNDARLNTNRATSHIESGGTLSAANAELVTIKYSLNVHSGGTFIAPAKDTLILGGFINRGTFTHSNGLVTFAPNQNGQNEYQVLTNGTGAGKDFYDVKLNKKRQRFNMNGDMQVNNITLAKGYWNVAGNDLYVKGDYTVHSSNRREVTNTSASTSVIFNGTGNQNVIAHNSGSWPSFENLTIDNTSGVVSFSTKNVGIQKTLTINSGATLDINGLNMTAATLVTVSYTHLTLPTKRIV